MANHSPYPHQGPGPSYYHQPSPPPHHAYGGHSPGPRPNYYYPPQHMNNGHYPQHAPRGRGGYSSRGGGQHYAHAHTYHHQQQPQYIPSHPSSPLGVHPPPHLQQPIPYSPQSAKYPQPYSPSYHYPSPTAPVFTPSWQQQQQPLSPLPKQLSMPPPQHIQALYEPTPAPAQQEQTQTPPVQPTEEEAVPEQPAEVAPPSPQPTPAEEVPVIVEQPAPPSPALEAAQTQSSSYSQMGSIQTSDSSTTPPSPSTSPSATSNPVPQYAIWSRRPQDPTQAPSIIISPRARPPPDVVHQALDLKTPPPSRPASPPIVPSVSAPKVSPDGAFLTPPSSDAAWSSHTSSTVPSSSATETTDTPTIPGSPASSHTSISVAGTPLKDSSKEVAHETEADGVAVPASTGSEVPAVAPPSSTDETTVASSELPSTSTSAVNVSDVAASAPAESTPTPTPIVASPSTSALPTPTTVAAPTPTPAAPPAPKKSWASLLRTGASSSSSTSPGPSRNALPTSTVKGISVPADSLPTNPSVPVSANKKSELLTLLTTGPAAPPLPTPTTTSGGFAAAAAAPASTSQPAIKIRPRGLVNSGNMCFANSVLQILVYCPPFHRLFSELGRLLVGPVLGSNANKDEKASAAGATPLVDATAAFLQEFTDEKRKSSSRKLEVVTRSGNGVNGAGSSGFNGSGKAGKGKEKEVKQDLLDDDEWEGDSFLPTYIYDAMKTKKRFDTMRGGQQEDAEEFFGFYLDTLEEELLSIINSLVPKPAPKPNGVAPSSTSTSSPTPTSTVEEKEESVPPSDDGWLEVGRKNRTYVTRTTKATESPITRIFGGKFRSTLRAPGQKDSVVVEDWRSLRLDIQRDQIHTIQDALSYISHPQPVQLTTPSSSTTLAKTIEAHQQVLIDSLPPILVLHLKRFCYDPASGGVVKVGKHVRFGPELEVGSDVVVPAALAGKRAVRYKLFGALYHHGHSASGGHYTLDVLHPTRFPNAPANPTPSSTKSSSTAKSSSAFTLPSSAPPPTHNPREGWVRIDDELVSDVRPEDVFNAHERDDSRCAYLLFYRRV